MPQEYGHPVDINERCIGTTRRGQPCKKHALVGRPLCAIHGGEAAEWRRAHAILRQTVPSELLKAWEQFLRQDNSAE